MNIEKSLTIEGWMSEVEIKWLATQAAENHTIIEIGSWFGRSTRALGDNAVGKVYAVDHWAGSAAESDVHSVAKLSDGDYVYNKFVLNNFDLIESGKILPIRMMSKNASILLKEKGIQADMIFIDGGHTYEEVIEDIKNWHTLLKDGGLICGHDYSDSWQGVKQAVNEVFKNIEVVENGTIWYIRIDKSKVIINKVDESLPVPVKDGITVGIPTKNRYDILSHTLLSIALQTLKPNEIIIVDESDSLVDLRNIPIYAYIFRLFDNYNIKWHIIFGLKKGQHISHQIIQEKALYKHIYRIDDDEIAQPNVLEILHNTLKSNSSYGAVAPLVLTPGSPYDVLPEFADNLISNLELPNIQWYKWRGIKEVDHLHSSFMYVKGIERFHQNLSPVAHREETIFTYGITRKGFMVAVNSDAIIWHFRHNSGGIRSHNNASYYEFDEKVFNALKNLWNVKNDLKFKFVVLDNGIGDHYAFKNILPDLKEKYKKVIVACCYADVFSDVKDVEIVSIMDAIRILGDINDFNVYDFMDKNSWDKSLTEAFKSMYL